ncbi:MAG: LdpA C-terminal domain-containing domain [Cyanobacteriota bacterium]
MSCAQHNLKILNDTIETLENKCLFKLICGASLTDTDIIRDLTFLYALAGAHIIDVSPDISVVDSAIEGINKAKQYFESDPKKFFYFNEPMLMISLNAGEDPHFKTAFIDNNKCNYCKNCVDSCSFEAIKYSDQDKNISINEKLCYGCGKCIDKCQNAALYLINNTVNIEHVFTKLINYSIAGIEIHVGKSNIEDLNKFWEEITKVLGKDCTSKILFSFSLESAMYTNKAFVEYTKNIVSMVGKKPIIQVDGTPMSGSNLAASSLQSMASGQVLERNNVEAYIVLAGGINHLTAKYLKMFELDCHGIAMGTYARKLVWPYLRILDNKSNFEKAIRITTNLVQRLEF